MTAQATIKPPSEVYGMFCSNVDQAAVQRVLNAAAIASGNHVTRFHLLFQSTGGSVADGVCLYNFLKTCPVPFTLYNAGSIMSIATVAYLGAHERKTSAHATFNLHRTTATLQAAPASTLEGYTESLFLDDTRTEAILREHLTLTKEQWTAINRPAAGLFLSAEDAIRVGLAQAIGEFAPPPGTQIFSI